MNLAFIDIKKNCHQRRRRRFLCIFLCHCVSVVVRELIKDEADFI